MTERPPERPQDGEENSGEDAENGAEGEDIRRENANEERTETNEGGAEDSQETDNEQRRYFFDLMRETLELETEDELEAALEAALDNEATEIAADSEDQDEFRQKFESHAFERALDEERKHLQEQYVNEGDDEGTAIRKAAYEVGARREDVERLQEQYVNEGQDEYAAGHRARHEAEEALAQRAEEIARETQEKLEAGFKTEMGSDQMRVVAGLTRQGSGAAFNPTQQEREPEPEGSEPEEAPNKRLNPFVTRAREALETDNGREAAKDKKANEIAASGADEDQFLRDFEPEAFNRAMNEEKKKLRQQYVDAGLDELTAGQVADQVMKHGMEKEKQEQETERLRQQYVEEERERLRQRYIDAGVEADAASRLAAGEIAQSADAIAKRAAQEVAQRMEGLKRDRLQRMTQRSGEISREVLSKLEKSYGAPMGYDQMRVTATRVSITHEEGKLREQLEQKFINEGATKDEAKGKAKEKAAQAIKQKLATFDINPQIRETLDEADIRARVQMQKEAARLIASGLVYPEQIVMWRKSNSKRADIAAPGFPYQLGELTKATSRYKAGKEVMTAGEAREWRNQFVQNAQFGAMIAGRPEAVHSAALTMRQKIEEAFNEMRKTDEDGNLIGTDENLQIELARFRAVHRLASQVNMDNATHLDSLIGSINVPIGLRTSYKNPATGEGLSFIRTDEGTGRQAPMNIGQMADMYEADPNIGQTMYNRTPSFYSSYQQQYQAEMAREQAEQEARRRGSQGNIGQAQLGIQI